MDAPKSNFGAPEEGGRKWYCVPRFVASPDSVSDSVFYEDHPVKTTVEVGEAVKGNPGQAPSAPSAE